MFFVYLYIFYLWGSDPSERHGPPTEPDIVSRSDSGSSQSDLAKDQAKTATTVSGSQLPSLYYEKASVMRDLARKTNATEYDRLAFLYALESVMRENDPTLEEKASLLRSSLGSQRFEAFQSAMEEANPGVDWTIRLDNLIRQRRPANEFEMFLRDMGNHLEEAPVTSRRLLERVYRHMGNTTLANRIHQEIEHIYQELRVIVTQ